MGGDIGPAVFDSSIEKIWIDNFFPIYLKENNPVLVFQNAHDKGINTG